MKYYAKTNTATPATGFITVGEVLTEKQAETLGEEKLRELVERGVLGATGESPRRPEPPAVENAEPAEDAEAEPEAEIAEMAEDAEDELPALDAGDVIEDEPPAAPKKRGGRKAK